MDDRIINVFIQKSLLRFKRLLHKLHFILGVHNVVAKLNKTITAKNARRKLLNLLLDLFFS
jgi:hypothetical protein